MLRFAVLIVLLSPLWSRAELYSEGIAFQRVLQNQDVVIGTVYKIYQDRQGFIWFGSENALTRYDGYTLRPAYFYEAMANAERRKNVAILDIYEDENDIMWLASSVGLLYHDKRTNRLVHAPHHKSLAHSPVTNAYLRKIVSLGDGRIAAASYTGLYILRPATGEGKYFNSKTPGGIQYDSVRSLYFDGEQSLWIGTGFGLDVMDITTGKIQHYKPFSEKPLSVPHNCVTSIVPGAGDTLWLGTRRGVLEFNPKTEQYRRYFHEKEHRHGSPSSDVWTLFPGVNDSIWVGREIGLIQFDPTTREAVYFKHDAQRLSSISSNVIRTVFTDRDNNTWVSTYANGVNYLDDRNTNISVYKTQADYANSLSHDSVLSIAEDQAGGLWLGTDGGGLNYLDRKKNTFTHFRYSPQDRASISSDRILSLFLGSRDTLWGGTWGGGVFYLDLLSNKIVRLPTQREAALVPGLSRSTSLRNDKVWSVMEDRQGYLWFATIRSGLSRYDRNSGEFLHYTHDQNDPNSIPRNHVWTTLEDSQGRFWVGSTGGLSLLHRNTHKFENFASDSKLSPTAFPWSVTAIFEDAKGRIWVGTDTGLYQFDLARRQYVHYGLDDGFIDDSIRSIAEDRHGALWLGTNGGVVWFDPESLDVKNFYRENGKLIGGANYNAALLTATGSVAVGGKTGLRLFEAQPQWAQSEQKKPIFTDFKIFNQPVNYAQKDSPLNEPITKARSVQLNYDDTYFTIEFSNLDYSNIDKVQYSYKLEGFDQQWNDIGSKRSAVYTNLDPGDYRLKVRSKTGIESWSSDYSTLGISIKPPWWRTPYAYFGLLLLLMLVGLYLRYNQSLRETIKENRSNLEIKRRLNQRVTKALEDERKSISQEVHDNVNSNIVAMRMIMQNIERISHSDNIDKDTVRYLAEKADALLAQTYDYFRGLLHKLRPEVIETLGFVEALQGLVDNYGQITAECQFEMTVEGEQPRLADEVGIELYRVAQEALSNAIKHAAATLITVSLLFKDEELELIIADNGKGFQRDTEPGLGIAHMTDRVQALNGRFSILHSDKQRLAGTTVRVCLPLERDSS